MCACVIPVCVNVCTKAENILKKIRLYGIEHLQSNGTSSILFSLTLTFIFKVKLVSYCLLSEYLVNGEK